MSRQVCPSSLRSDEARARGGAHAGLVKPATAARHGAAVGATVGKFAKHRILPPRSGGLIAFHDSHGADTVERR
jgi:hypothetical protein